MKNISASSFRRRFGFALSVLVTLWFTLCGPVAFAAKGSAEPVAEEKVKTGYRLHAMDLIRVQVFQEPDLDRELRVSKDLQIVVPLVGAVSVKNLTVRETEQLLTELYKKDYLVNPQINVIVADYAARSVNIFGAVNSPNSVVIPPERELTLLDAIARCGGFSRLANRSKVSLTRTSSDGESQNYVVDTDKLVSGSEDARWLLQDGDIIFVPERVL